MQTNLPHSEAGWWDTAIRSAARDKWALVRVVVAGGIFAFLVAQTAITNLWPQDAATVILPFGITATKRTKDLLSVAASVIGLLFSLKVIPTLRDWYEPDSRRYLAAADHTIESLRSRGVIDEFKKNTMKDIAHRLLSAHAHGKPKRSARDALRDACSELGAAVAS